MKIGSLFSGIGGFDLGLERAGITVRWQVENDPYCNRVLRKHWPDVVRYGDIRAIDWRTVEPVDLVCGGFPCQPVSIAGKRRGRDDERWLWPEFARCLGILRPSIVLIENVPGLLVRGFADVLRDLAACRYDAEWDCLPASAFGAPHRRDRVLVVAYRQGDGVKRRIFESWEITESGANGEDRTVADADVPRQSQSRILGGESQQSLLGSFSRQRHWWAVEPDVGRVAHGIPNRVDRLRGLGNAVVPQVIEWLGRKIIDGRLV